MPIIEFDSARFTYDGKAFALDGVNLRVEPGEFVCVLGGNGSGKSTLAKHVNALLASDEGSVNVLGRDTRDAENVFFVRSNAGMVFQNPDDQIVASGIEDDVAFGPENLGVPADELRKRVTQALEQVGLQGFEQRETTSLSGGQKQRVAIAGVLAMEPQILVLDEASAMLDPRGRAGLLRLCRELNGAGLTVVYITHFMEEAADADRVIAMDAGRIVMDGPPADVLTQVDQLRRLHLDIPFAAHMSCELQARGVSFSPQITLDALISELQQKPTSPEAQEGGPALNSAAKRGLSEHGRPLPPLRGEQAEHAIKLNKVSFTYHRGKHAIATEAQPADWGNDPGEQWALRNVSLEIEQGEFFGIAGHTGSGKSTLIQLASGLLRPTAGQVAIDGVDLSDKKHAREARRAVGVVFQYPERQLFAATVFDDVAFGPRNLGLDAEQVETRVRGALAAVHLDLDALRDKSPFTLSGGQQRRVAFAGVLAMNPQVLILDEPTAGLDPQSRASLLELVSELHDERGLTVVFVSHSMDDLARLCDRVAILNRGGLVSVGTPAEVFADAEGLHGIGLGIPQTLQLANALGLPASDHVPTIEELADEIASRLNAPAPAEAEPVKHE